MTPTRQNARNASHDDAVCDLCAGDISTSANSRNREQWFSYAAEFGLEANCKGLQEAMTRNTAFANLLPDLANLLRTYITL